VTLRQRLRFVGSFLKLVQERERKRGAEGSARFGPRSAVMVFGGAHTDYD